MNLCDDNRTATIEAAKMALIKGTNIEDSPDEMKALDSFLLRCWQMGWLNRYEPPRHFNAMPKETSERMAAGHGSNALKALNSVNATKFNALDSISRQAAIEVVQNRPMMLSKEKVLLINDLEKLPPTELKREKTRFVYENGKWICEKCGNEIRQIEQSGFFIFCPSCGAEKEMKRL